MKKIKDDPVLAQQRVDIIRNKDEITRLEWEVEKIWKVVIDQQKHMAELENIIRSATSNIDDTSLQ